MIIINFPFFSIRRNTLAIGYIIIFLFLSAAAGVRSMH